MQKSIALLLILAVSSSLQNPVESEAQSEVQSVAEPRAQSKYVIPIIKVNWHKAVEYCNQRGLRLAEIDSVQTEVKLIDAIKDSNIYSERNVRVWVGGSDLADEGDWHWHNTGNRVTYSNWFEHQPDNAKGVEHCLEVGTFENRWGWNDRECNTKHYFVCE